MSVATVAAPPAVVCEPPGRAGSYGDDVAEIAENIGRPLVPEQLLAVDVLTAHDRRGRFLSVEAGIEVARQNGKTGAVILPIILWSCLTDPDEYVWSAHMADTTSKAFFELVGRDDGDESALMRQYPWLGRRIRSVQRTHGNEGVQFSNGATLGFRCRSTGRGRGLSGTGLVIDETLVFDAEQAASLLPVLATRSLHGNARVYYGSSSAARSSEYLRSLRRRAVAGDPTLTYIGWWARGSWADPGCESEGCLHEVGVPGCSLDDESRWAEANPLLGRFTSVDYLRGMRKQMLPLQFGREFMGWQEDGSDALDAERWDALTDPQSTPLPSPLALSLEVAPKGASAAVLAAGIRADGLVHVEVVAHAPGTSWLAELLLAKQAAHDVPIHYRAGRTHTRSVVPGLEAAGVRLEPMSLADYAAGCGGMDELMESGGIRHRGDPRLKDGLGRVVRKLGPDGTWVMTWSGTTGDASTAMALPTALRALTGAPTAYDLDASVL